MALLGSELANIYQNLTNIILTITPMAHQHAPAVLVNGHYDSAIGSPGSFCCMQCLLRMVSYFHTRCCSILTVLMHHITPSWQVIHVST